MPDLAVTVRAFGPLLFRDARPFRASGDESRASSLELPPPTTLAGLIRTVLGRAGSLDWKNPRDLQRARQIKLKEYRFAVERSDGTIIPVAPKPASTLVVERAGELVLDDLRPTPDLAQGRGCTLPAGVRPLEIQGQEKPKQPVDGWWLEPSIDEWLAGQLSSLPQTVAAPMAEQRVQIGTQPGSRQAAEGMLFTVDYRLWESCTSDGELVRWVAEARLSLPEDLQLPQVGSQPGVFGGEQRPAMISWAPAEPNDHAPHPLAAGARRVTIYLATPALFTGGWRPGWADHPERLHTGLAGARLVGAAVGRPQPVSGWSLEPSTFGPKPTRWAAPAGSVYFLELAQPLSLAAAEELAKCAVCDPELDEGNGYGQARLGVWQ